MEFLSYARCVKVIRFEYGKSLMLWLFGTLHHIIPFQSLLCMLIQMSWSGGKSADGILDSSHRLKTSRGPIVVAKHRINSELASSDVFGRNISIIFRNFVTLPMDGVAILAKTLAAVN